MIARKQKSAYTIKSADGRFKVFCAGKFRQSFATDLDARAFVAACECQAHAKAKRTVAQLAAAPLLALALLVQPAPVQAAWQCTPWRWTRHIHHTAAGSHWDWSRTRECWQSK